MAVDLVTVEFFFLHTIWSQMEGLSGLLRCEVCLVIDAMLFVYVDSC